MNFQMKQLGRFFLLVIATRKLTYMDSQKGTLVHSCICSNILNTDVWQIDKSINAMYRRLQRNLTSEELLPSLWDKCKVIFSEDLNTSTFVPRLAFILNF